MPNIIYAAIESSIKKKNGCANNPENFSTTKIGEHIPCGYSMSTIWAFHDIENKQFISQKRLYEKVSWFFKRACKKI